MFKIFSCLTIALLLAAAAAAQKGIDTQTQRIKDDANKTTTRSANESSRSFDWGKGKTAVRGLLPNPYKLNGRRGALIDTVVEVLKEKRMIVDEASSRMADGIIITQPFTFAKGPVTAQSELKRYAVLNDADTAWSRGRYTLTVEVQSIDGIQNNVVVNAKVEGRTTTGLISEWTTLSSSGVAEDEFLAKLVEAMTGQSPNLLKTDSDQ